MSQSPQEVASPAVQETKETKQQAQNYYQLLTSIPDDAAAQKGLDTLAEKAGKALESLITIRHGETVIESPEALKAIQDKRAISYQIEGDKLREYLRTTHEELHQYLSICRALGVERKTLVQGYILLARAYYFAAIVLDEPYFTKLTLETVNEVSWHVYPNNLSPMDNYVIGHALLEMMKMFPDYDATEPLPKLIHNLVWDHLHTAKNDEKAIAISQVYFQLLAGEEWNKEFVQVKVANPQKPGFLQKFRKLLGKMTKLKELTQQTHIKNELQRVMDVFELSARKYDAFFLIESAVKTIFEVIDVAKKEIKSIKESKNDKALKTLKSLEALPEALSEIAEGFQALVNPAIEENIQTTTSALEEKKREKTAAKKYADLITKFHQDAVEKMESIDTSIRYINHLVNKIEDAIPQKEENERETVIETKATKPMASSGEQIQMKVMHKVKSALPQKEKNESETVVEAKTTKAPISSAEQFNAQMKEIRAIPAKIMEFRKVIPDTIFNMSPVNILSNSTEEFLKNFKAAESSVGALRKLSVYLSEMMEKIDLIDGGARSFTLNDLRAQLKFLHEKMQRQYYLWAKYSQKQLVALSKEDAMVPENVRAQEMYCRHITKVNLLMSIYDGAVALQKSMESEWNASKRYYVDPTDVTDQVLMPKEAEIRRNIPELLHKLKERLAELSPEKFEGGKSVLMEIARLKKIFETKITMAGQIGILAPNYLTKMTALLENLQSKIERARDMWKSPDFSHPKLTPEACKEKAEKLLSKCTVKADIKTSLPLYERMREEMPNPRAGADLLFGLTSIANEELDAMMNKKEGNDTAEDRKAISHYLETTHEALHLCLQVSETFQTKDGKPTYAIPSQLVERAHAVLARGYYLAGHLRWDKVYLEHLSKHQSTHQKNLMTPNLHTPIDNYCAGISIIEYAKNNGRRLTPKEFYHLYKYLYAAISSEKRKSSQVDDQYGELARELLKQLVGQLYYPLKKETDAMLRVGREQRELIGFLEQIMRTPEVDLGDKIAQLAGVVDEKKSSQPPASEVGFIRSHQACMIDIYEGLHRIKLAGSSLPQSKFLPANDSMCSADQRMQYSVITGKISEWRKTISESLLMKSPVVCLLASARGQFSTSKKESMETLKEMGESISQFLLDWENEPGDPNEEEREFIKELDALNKVVRERLYGLKNYIVDPSEGNIKEKESAASNKLQEYMAIESQCQRLRQVFSDDMDVYINTFVVVEGNDRNKLAHKASYQQLKILFRQLYKDIGECCNTGDSQKILKQIDELDKKVDEYINKWKAWIGDGLYARFIDPLRKFKSELQSLRDNVSTWRVSPVSIAISEQPEIKSERDEKQSVAPDQKLKALIEKADRELISLLSVKEEKLSINRKKLETYLKTTHRKLSDLLDDKNKIDPKLLNDGYVLLIRTYYFATYVSNDQDWLGFAREEMRQKKLMPTNAIDHMVFADVIQNTLEAPVKKFGEERAFTLEGAKKAIESHCVSVIDSRDWLGVPQNIRQHFISLARNSLMHPLKLREKEKRIVKFHQEIAQGMRDIDQNIEALQRTDFRSLSSLQRVEAGVVETKNTKSSVGDLSKMADHLFNLRQNIPNNFDALPYSLLQDVSKNIENVRNALPKLQKFKEAILGYIRNFEASPKLTKEQENVLNQLKKLHQKTQRQWYCCHKFSNKHLLSLTILGKEKEATREAKNTEVEQEMSRETYSDHILRANKLMKVYDDLQSQWDRIDQLWSNAEAHVSKESDIEDHQNIRRLLTNYSEYVLLLSPESFGGCKEALAFIKDMKKTLKSAEKVISNAELKKNLIKIVEKLEELAQKIQEDSSFESIQGMWDSPMFAAPKSTHEYCKEKAQTLVIDYEDGKKTSSTIRKEMENYHVAHDLLLGLSVLANEELNYLMGQAKDDVQNIGQREAKKYLATIHETLYQCLVIGEEFRDKNGSLYAINLNVLNHAHITLARGYDMARKVFKDERFSQYETYEKSLASKNLHSSGEKNAERSLTFDAEFNRVNSMRMLEIKEAYREASRQRAELPKSKRVKGARKTYTGDLDPAGPFNKQMRRTFFEMSPAKYLLSDAKARSEDLTKAVQALRELSESIVRFVADWDAVEGIPEDGEIAFIQQLKSLNKKICTCARSWEIYAHEIVRPKSGTEKVRHEAHLSRLLSVELFAVEYGYVEDQCEKIEETWDKIEEYIENIQAAARVSDLLDLTDYHLKNSEFLQRKSQLQELYQAVKALPDNVDEVIKKLNRFIAGVEVYASNSFKKYGNSPLKSLLDTLKKELEVLKTHVQNAKKLIEEPRESAATDRYESAQLRLDRQKDEIARLRRSIVELQDEAKREHDPITRSIHPADIDAAEHKASSIKLSETEDGEAVAASLETGVVSDKALVESKSSGVPEQKSTSLVVSSRKQLDDLIQQSDRELIALVSVKDDKLMVDSVKLKAYFDTTHKLLYHYLNGCITLPKEEKARLGYELGRAHALCIRAYYFAYKTFNDEAYLTFSDTHAVVEHLNPALLSPLDNTIIADIIGKSAKDVGEELPVPLRTLWVQHVKAAQMPGEPKGEVHQYLFNQLDIDFRRLNYKKEEKIDEKLKQLIKKIENVKDRIPDPKIKEEMKQHIINRLDGSAFYYDVLALVRDLSLRLTGYAKKLNKQLSYKKDAKEVATTDEIVGELNIIEMEMVNLFEAPKKEREKIVFEKYRSMRANDMQRLIGQQMRQIDEAIQSIQKMDAKEYLKIERYTPDDIKASATKTFSDLHHNIQDLRKGIPETCLDIPFVHMYMNDWNGFMKDIKDVRDAVPKLNNFRNYILECIRNIEKINALTPSQKNLLTSLKNLCQKVDRQLYAWMKFSSPKLVEILKEKEDMDIRENINQHLGRVWQLKMVYEEIFPKLKVERDQWVYHTLQVKDFETRWRFYENVQELMRILNKAFVEMRPETFEGFDEILHVIRVFMEYIERRKKMLSGKLTLSHGEALAPMLEQLDVLAKRIKVRQDIWKSEEFMPKRTPEECRKIVEGYVAECKDKKISIRQLILERLSSPIVAKDALTGFIEIAKEESEKLMAEFETLVLKAKELTGSVEVTKEESERLKKELKATATNLITEYLSSTHEGLYQCLQRSEVFQTKEGETTYAIPAQVIGRAHALLSRGYYIASKIIKDERFSQYAKKHQENILSPNVISAIDICMAVMEKVEDGKLTQKEKLKLHKQLNLVIKSEKTASKVEKVYTNWAEAQLRVMLKKDSKEEVVFEPDERKIEALYRVSPKENYLAAMDIINGAKDRKMMPKEKEMVHLLLNDVIKPEEKASDEDRHAVVLAKSELCEMLHLDEVRFEPREQEITKLYQSKTSGLSADTLFRQENQAHIAKIYDHVQNLKKEKIRLLLPLRKGKGSRENKNVPYDSIIEKIEKSKNEMPEVIFMQSPAAFLLSDAKEIFANSAEASRGLITLSTSIMSCIETWEKEPGPYFEDEETFIKHLATINKEVRQCAYRLAQYADAFSKSDVKKELGEKIEAVHLAVQPLVHQFDDIEARWEKVEDIFDRVEVYLNEIKDIPNLIGTSYQVGNATYIKIRDSLRNFYKEIIGFPKNAETLVTSIEKLKQEFQEKIKQHRSMIGVNEFETCLKSLEQEFLGIVQKLDPMKNGLSVLPKPAQTETSASAVLESKSPVKKETEYSLPEVVGIGALNSTTEASSSWFSLRNLQMRLRQGKSPAPKATPVPQEVPKAMSKSSGGE